MKAVDAFVESSADRGETWARLNDPHPDFRWFDGPWSVSNAVEIGRGCWASFLRVTAGHAAIMDIQVRVVDLDGVVVEQWPKPLTRQT